MKTPLSEAVKARISTHTVHSAFYQSKHLPIKQQHCSSCQLAALFLLVKHDCECVFALQVYQWSKRQQLTLTSRQKATLTKLLKEDLLKLRWDFLSWALSGLIWRNNHYNCCLITVLRKCIWFLSFLHIFDTYMFNIITLSLILDKDAPSKYKVQF